jgi:hypothetical protein
MLALALVLVAQADTAIGIAAAVRALAVALAVAVGLTVMLTIAFRDAAVGGMAAGVAMLLVRSGDVGPLITGLILVSLCSVAVWWSSRGSRGGWRRRGTATLNVIGGALLVVAVIGSATDEVAAVLLATSDRHQGEAENPAAAPDIYLLLLDGYPRADTIQRILGTDNRGLLGGLESMGFEISSEASTNYMYTAPSLMSLFDLGDMGSAAHQFDSSRSHSVRPGDVINKAPLWALLHDVGYTTYAGLARWERESVRSADHFCDGGALNELEVHLLRTTLFGNALDAVSPDWRADRDRDVINAQFKCLAEAAAARASAPKFVFAHIGGPHKPIVFDRNGGAADPAVYLDPLELTDANRPAVFDAYREQLAYVNERTLTAIEDVTAASERPPVIIVMSDHGSWLQMGGDYSVQSDLRERFAILFAALTPGHDSLYPDDVVSGQVMPILANAYLGTDLSVPEGRYYFSRYDSIFDFTEMENPFRRP